MINLPSIQDVKMDFCATGTKDSVAQSSETDINFQTGLPASFSTKISEPGGKYISRAVMNAIGNLMLKAQAFRSLGGTFTFNQAVSDAIGGYPSGAILAWNIGMSFYFVRSIISNNTYNFVTTPSYVDGQKWKVISALGIPSGWPSPNYSSKTSVTIPTTGYTATKNVQIVAKSGQAWMKASGAANWIQFNRGTGYFIYYLSKGDSIHFEQNLSCDVTNC